MIRAMVKKELRETWVFAALALLLSSVYVCRQTGVWSRALIWTLSWLPGFGEGPALLPFIQSGFGAMFGMVGFALAMTLGFRQSTWDVRQGWAAYLLHLPCPRHKYFLIKLSTGMALALACMAVPIVWYAAWAAWPRSHPAPFQWSMVEPALRLWILLPLLYLAAFASGIRPARWYGSRLLPLVAIALPALFAYNTAWLVGLPLVVLLSAALVNNILLDGASSDF